MTSAKPAVAEARIVATLTIPLSNGWNRVPGIDVAGERLTIDPNRYFFRYENPRWRLCDWTDVRDRLLPMVETPAKTIEQATLEFVRDNSFLTTDPVDVLRTAEQVYGFMFRSARLADADLVSMGITRWHLCILREMGMMMALNRVELDGHLSNVGPAWFFCQLAESVFGLTREQTLVVDELYHGTFFNEERRVESIKAHAALGGRLVHGCSALPNMAGGCVVEYGTDVASFHDELRAVKPEWLAEIDTYPRRR